MHQDFFNWLSEWEGKLTSVKLSELGNPKNIAVVSVDMINGFCHKGPLASEKVNNIIPTVVDVFTKANNAGVEHFLMLQDTHAEDAEEFTAFPPHCIKGTEESQNISELTSLPFADKFKTFEKNALSPMYDTNINEWIANHPEIDAYILVGDCTDLCVYNMAMNLRMHANAFNIKRRVIVPANAVATYDMSVETAQKLGGLPHPAGLLHPMFLYHMQLNGIEIIKEIS